MGLMGIVWAFGLWTTSCGFHSPARIAVIPQSDGNLQWDPAHVGAETAAEPAEISIYWNAPTREDDVEAQIRLVDNVVNGNYQGLVLAPDQALSLIMPVRRALARGIPTVIIGSPLPIPAGGNLSYILNDDAEGGRLAAERVAGLLNGQGSIALLGINPDITGVMIRARSLEHFLAHNYPGIQIVDKQMGSFDVLHEQQMAETTLKANPHLGAIVALMSTTVDGIRSALLTTPEMSSVKVIGFDATNVLFTEPMPSLDCVIQEDTRAMGKQAIELIHSRMLGQTVPATVYLHPKLITHDNINTQEVRQMLSTDFTLGRWRWSLIQ